MLSTFSCLKSRYMKRDMDLVRSILIAIEASDNDPSRWIKDLDLCGDHRPEEVTSHLLLLHEAGLIEGQVLNTLDGVDYRVKRLTWEGHEFLDAARDDNLWKRGRDKVLKEVGALPFELLKAVLFQLAKKELGL